MKEEIIKKLKELHKEQGIVFTSEDDAMRYYMALVELIEQCSNTSTKKEKKEVNFDGVLMDILLQLVDAIDKGHNGEQWVVGLRKQIYDLPGINRTINNPKA